VSSGEGGKHRGEGKGIEKEQKLFPAGKNRPWEERGGRGLVNSREKKFLGGRYESNLQKRRGLGGVAVQKSPLNPTEGEKK